MRIELWATVGTIVGTLALAVVPGVVYAWIVLEEWIGDRYPDV